MGSNHTAHANPTTSNNTNGKNNSGGGEKSHHQAALRERYLHLIISLVGQNVTLRLIDGSAIEGIFHTFTPFTMANPAQSNQYVIKACRRTQPSTKTTKTAA